MDRDRAQVKKNGIEPNETLEYKRPGRSKLIKLKDK